MKNHTTALANQGTARPKTDTSRRIKGIPANSGVNYSYNRCYVVTA